MHGRKPASEWLICYVDELLEYILLVPFQAEMVVIVWKFVPIKN